MYIQGRKGVKQHLSSGGPVLPEADVKLMVKTRRGLCRAGWMGTMICSARISGVTPGYTQQISFWFSISIKVAECVIRGMGGAPIMKGRALAHYRWCNVECTLLVRSGLWRWRDLIEFQGDFGCVKSDHCGCCIPVWFMQREHPRVTEEVESESKNSLFTCSEEWSVFRVALMLLFS